MKVSKGSELPENFLEQVCVDQDSVLLLLLSVMANAREGLMNEIFYADDTVLMSKCIKKLKIKILK